MQDTHEYTNTQKYLLRGGVEAVALCPDVAIVTGDGGSGDHPAGDQLWKMKHDKRIRAEFINLLTHPAGDQLHKSRIYQKSKTS